MKINRIQNYKHWYLLHTCSNTAFKGTVVDRTLSSLHEGPLETMRTVPLKEEKTTFKYGGEFSLCELYLSIC